MMKMDIEEKHLSEDKIKRNFSDENDSNDGAASEDSVPKLQTRPLFKRLYAYSIDERKRTSPNISHKTSESVQNETNSENLDFTMVACKIEPMSGEEQADSGHLSEGGDLENNNQNAMPAIIKDELADFDEVNIKQEPPDSCATENEVQQREDTEVLKSDVSKVVPAKQNKFTEIKRRTRKRKTSKKTEAKEWEVELEIPQEIKIGVPDRRRTVKLISEEEASSSFVGLLQGPLSLQPLIMSWTDDEIEVELGTSDSETDSDFISEVSDSDSDEYSDSEDETDESDDSASERSTITWSDDLIEMKNIPFSKKQELSVSTENLGPMDFFNLLVDNDFLQAILVATNKSIKELDESRNTNHREVSSDELRLFLAVLFNMGNVQVHEICNYWKENDMGFDFPWFREQLTLNRFSLILRCLHYGVDDQQLGFEDSLSKMRPMINYFNRKMEEVYYPAKELIIDESLLMTRRRLYPREMLKKRFRKYGLKLYTLTEPNGLCLKFAVTSKSACNFGDKASMQKVAMHLLQEKLGKGHSVYLHYHYNSVDLAVRLLEKGTYCTGMLCKNRPNNPVDIISAKLKKNQLMMQYAKNVAVGLYNDAIFMSTEFDGTLIEIVKRDDKRISPNSIVHFMKFVAKTDRIDQLLSCYPCSKDRFSWKTKIFIHILEMLMLNSYLLYSVFGKGKLEFYRFRMHIIKKLLPVHGDPAVDSDACQSSSIVDPICTGSSE